jgi:DNA-binding CsgD family transcriptional regulator
MPATRGTALPSLTRWGVSPDGDLVYRALLRDGTQRTAELSRSLGLPVRRVRAALDELAGTGAARRSVPAGRADGARVWHGTPADVAVPGLRRRQVALAQARYRLHDHLVSLGGLGIDVPEPAGSDAVRPLFGGARVRTRIAELVAGQRREYLAMHPEPAFDSQSARAAAPVSRSLGRRGMSVLTLGVPAVDGDATGEYEADFAASGMAYRELPSLPTKFLVFDRGVAIVPFDPSDTGAGGFEVRAEGTVAALVALFFRRWEQARPQREGARRRMELTARERAIVTLLARGHTDTSVSAQLGLSVRTIAYTLRGLMDRYGVQNRFQLGLLLGTGEVDGLSLPGTEEQE